MITSAIGNNEQKSERVIVHGVIYCTEYHKALLGLLLFNIYINDLFLFSQNFTMANYADDCSPYEFSGSIGDVIQKLESRLTNSYRVV